MSVEIAMSESAVAVLRFEIEGWRAKKKESRLPAYRELDAAGSWSRCQARNWRHFGGI